MKTLGLIGGISWVSTAEYYKLINEGVNAQLGGLNFARCVVYSFNFADIKKNNDANDWDATFRLVADAADKLKASGAEGLVLCANTMHLIADRLAQAGSLPLIHIATATAAAIQARGLKRVGLLGTRFTMERDFFTDQLRAHGIEALIPAAEADRAFVHDTIFEELGRNVFKAETKQRYLAIVDQLVADGAEGIILGCTEMPLLLQPGDLPVPSFDTVALHAAAAVSFMLAESSR